jgi:hypothetical protein
VVRGEVQQPITDFTGPWDDFMVHGVNNLLVLRKLDVFDIAWRALYRGQVGLLLVVAEGDNHLRALLSQRRIAWPNRSPKLCLPHQDCTLIWPQQLHGWLNS